MLLSHDKDQQ